MGTAPALLETQAIRRSISLPAAMAGSSNRAIVDLLSDGIAAHEQRRTAFHALADRFRNSTDPAETERLSEELAQMVFGS
jgi:hypothetical protein